MTSGLLNADGFGIGWYHSNLAADILPKKERVYLPALAEVELYLDAVRKKVLDYLEIAPIAQQERLWQFIIQHESQHCETVAFVLQIQQGKEEGIKLFDFAQGTGKEEGILMPNSQFPIPNSRCPIRLLKLLRGNFIWEAIEFSQLVRSGRATNYRWFSLRSMIFDNW